MWKETVDTAVRKMQEALQSDLADAQLLVFRELGSGASGTVYHGAAFAKCASDAGTRMITLPSRLVLLCRASSEELCVPSVAVSSRHLAAPPFRLGLPRRAQHC